VVIFRVLLNVKREQKKLHLNLIKPHSFTSFSQEFHFFLCKFVKEGGYI